MFGWRKSNYRTGTLTQLPPLRTEMRNPVRGNRLKRSIELLTAMVLATAFSVSAQESPQLAPRAIPVAPSNAGPNDIARFLAGMPVPENSPLAPLTRDPAWQAHSAFFEGEFTKLYQRQLQKLHAWTATNLPEVTQPTPVAFYMFSGPDFFVRRSIFSQRLGVRALREGINGAAARSVAYPESLRRAGKSGKRNEVVVEHDILHHQKHEGRSATANPQWCIADSLRVYRTRR